MLPSMNSIFHNKHMKNLNVKIKLVFYDKVMHALLFEVGFCTSAIQILWLICTYLFFLLEVDYKSSPAQPILETLQNHSHPRC